MIHHLVPHYHFSDLPHFNQVADWPIIVWFFSAALLVVWMHHMELPSFQENLLLYREVYHMGDGRQYHLTGSLEDVAIQTVASKSSSSIVPLEDVPHFVPSDGNKGHRREGGSLRLSLVEGVPQPLDWVNFGDRDPSCP